MMTTEFIERVGPCSNKTNSFPSFVHSPSGSSRVIIDENPETLQSIRCKNVDLVIWRREVSALLSSWIHTSPIGDWPIIRQNLTPENVARMLRKYFHAAGLIDCIGSQLLIDDVKQLVMLYADAMRVDYVYLRLEPVHDDACRKFHRDYVSARLITTYRGPGTEWVTAENATKALRMQQVYDGKLYHVPTGSVAIFKGCLNGKEAGIQHRSPRIVSSGLTRLLLCINASNSGAYVNR